MYHICVFDPVVDPLYFWIGHLYISQNPPWLEANIWVLLHFGMRSRITELKYPYIGFQSRCIMWNVQMIYRFS